jgi:hypothetical protein
VHREICHLLSVIYHSRSARNTRFEWSCLFYINGPSGLISFRRGFSQMFTDLSIRPVARVDYAHWLPLWDSYNAFYGRSGPTALPAEITQITWARFFDAFQTTGEVGRPLRPLSPLACHPHGPPFHQSPFTSPHEAL